ncbi:hypothetical protein GJ744_010372 [Endocarpon pusillum]|uniref:Uncharacterized protein n=1 Tax=Endocarpon pusillum TaxID=364733 RepID=A0A8H7A7D6_9EURO|nr:hypothetical protein GJ744_010372 [Endocarpon pusillum]
MWSACALPTFRHSHSDIQLAGGYLVSRTIACRQTRKKREEENKTTKVQGRARGEREQGAGADKNSVSEDHEKAIDLDEMRVL